MISGLTAGSYMGSTGGKRRTSQDGEQNEKAGENGEAEHLHNGRTKRTRDADADDEEKQLTAVDEGTRGGWSHDELSRDALSNKQRGINVDNSFSRHQPLTPGWDSPWRPESVSEHSIHIGRYRFNNHGDGGYFPRSNSDRSARKGKKKSMAARGGLGAMLSSEWWRVFLLHNALVPLLFRSINIAFTSATLAIAIRLFIILRQQDAQDSVGSTPIVAIIFSPLTLLHVGIQIYLEYFSKPIGLWRVSSKLFYTLTELIFVCLWSAELSLAFDNYFTSTLVCTSFQSPFTTNGAAPGGAPETQPLNEVSAKPMICRLQGALIGLVFTSLLAYVVVFSLSLFRTFVRVTKK